MERRNLFTALLVGLLVGFSSSWSVAPSAAHAESGLDHDHIQVADEVKRVLTEGREFEVKQRWGEALTTYENALRIYPTDSELNRRMRITRLHYELDRRYSDDTFVSSIRRLSESESLSLMEEVATKLETHYVDNPDWRELLRCGTSSVQIALLDPTVRKTLGVQASAEQVREMIRAIWSTQSQQSFANRQEAIDFVRWSSRIVSRQMGVSPNAAIFEYVCGAMSSLDPYSTYLTEQQLEDVYSQIKGNFVGLGVELKTDTGTLLISDVISNGPAELAGVRSGDTIVQIDDKVVSELPVDVAADLLKGEQGSVVYLTLKNGEGQNRQVRVRRDRVEVPSVEDVKMLDPSKGIAYLKISSFQETTSRDVDAALWKLLGQGMRSLIIDVRGNPGGLLTESVEVADRFVMDGTIVSTLGRSTRENFNYKARKVGTWRVPLVVLIDGDSASASEIFAGAIRDHDRGIVVGSRSYGKGSVQGIFPLRILESGVRLTTAKFYSPNGKAISNAGVDPNVAVRTMAKPLESGELLASHDSILQAGIEQATRIIDQPVETRSEFASSASPSQKTGW